MGTKWGESKNPDYLARREAAIAWQRDYDYQKAFGISYDEYRALVDAAGGVCTVCKRPPKPGRSLCLDHNHETGEMRGVICRSCNSAIGLLDDDPDLFRKLAEYLEQPQLQQGAA